METIKTNKKVEQFGLIRFLGAMSIYFFHFFQIIGQSQKSNMDFLGVLKYVSFDGWLAVELFFMLSGFFMALNYEKRILNMSFGDYIVGRLRKIWLPTVLSGIICLIAYKGKYDWNGLYIFFLNISLTSTNWVEHGVFTYNGVTWYINALIVCYIFYYLIIMLCKDKTELVPVLYLLFVVIGWWEMTGDWDLPILSNPRGYLAFFIGTLLCKMYNYTKVNIKRLSCHLILIFIFVVLLCIVFHWDFFGGKMWLSMVFVIYPLVILAMMQIKITNSNLISILNFIGDLSMPLFFIHYPILVFVSSMKYDFCSLFGFVALIAVVLSFSYLFLILVKKMNRFLSRLYLVE